jgi:alpha-L-rhamnosidase
MARNEQDAAWSGAQLIGAGNDDQVLYAHYLPVFRLGCTVMLDRHSHSTSASILYGGNDERLMDANKNIYHLQARRDSSFIRIELDGNSITKGGQAKVKVYRKGYHPDDNADRPLTSFDIPQTIIGKHNLYQPHRMEVASNLGDSKIYVDGKEVGNVNLNPLGRGGDFIGRSEASITAATLSANVPMFSFSKLVCIPAVCNILCIFRALRHTVFIWTGPWSFNPRRPIDTMLDVLHR